MDDLKTHKQSGHLISDSFFFVEGIKPMLTHLKYSFASAGSWSSPCSSSLVLSMSKMLAKRFRMLENLKLQSWDGQDFYLGLIERTGNKPLKLLVVAFWCLPFYKHLFSIVASVIRKLCAILWKMWLTSCLDVTCYLWHQYNREGAGKLTEKCCFCSAPYHAELARCKLESFQVPVYLFFFSSLPWCKRG